MSSKIAKCLAVDTETSGIAFNSHCPADGHQIVSIGLIAVNVADFKPIEELYILIKWTGTSNWDAEAERVHGLSKEYLDANGVTEFDAAMQIGLFLDKHFGITKPLYLLGHNVASFDLPFLRQMLERHQLPFKFGHRHFDSFSLGVGTLRTMDSNELFETLGFQKRATHNSLEDARMALRSFQLISEMWRKMWDKYIG